MLKQPTQAEQNNVVSALRDRYQQFKVRRGSPELQDAAAKENIARIYQTQPDGADAETGKTAYDDAEDETLNRMLDDEGTNQPEEVYRAMHLRNQKDLKAELRLLTPSERAPATKQTVESKIIKFPVGDSFMAGGVKRIMSGLFPETEEIKQAKRACAQSKKTDVNPAVESIRYGKDVCTSRGQTVNYKTVMKKVEWGDAIKRKSTSPEESLEYLSSYLTNAVRDSYGGWGRVTEIIIRDQRLIINRTCFCPSIDPSIVSADMFPLDTLDYIKGGAIAGFFDWWMLKYMRNLQVLDVDDLGFYEVNIGGRLKCGRRIGVSTLFNLCPSLEVLILAGDEVTREALNSEEATEVKKKLSNHKRFSLFADGYKLNIMQGTDSVAGWTLGNLKNYANNRGNKGLLRYCSGVIARAGLFGVAGVVNLGTHLVGGIRNAFKEAMTPVNPEDVGLQ